MLFFGFICRAFPASALKADEQVVFYPTLGWRVPGGWEAELHGCVFELENRAVLAPLLRRALGLDDDELTAEERAIYRARARFFMVDHEGGRRLTVQLIGSSPEAKPVRLGPSRGDGQVRGRLRIQDQTLAKSPQTNGWLRYEMVAPQSGPESPATGEVLRLGETGWSVISDIDDTIKVSQVRDRQALLRNTFCRPFQPVPGMAEVYRGWARSKGAAFHYVSASPWQLYPPLAEFARSHGFPAGTFHLKDFRVRDGTFLGLFQSPERYKPGVIRPLLERFPGRRFVLVGDSGEKDPEIYAALARQYPKQIARICIRDVTGEGPDAARYREAFAGLPAGVGRVFREPAEITGAIP